jgi:hypothetical protein
MRIASFCEFLPASARATTSIRAACSRVTRGVVRRRRKAGTAEARRLAAKCACRRTPGVKPQFNFKERRFPGGILRSD